MNRLQECDATVAECLRRHADIIQSDGPGRWKLKLADGRRRLRLTASIQQNWLRVESPLNATRRQTRFQCDRLAELLCHNAQLRGGVKFGLNDGPPSVCLAAETPLDEPMDLDHWLPDVIAGVRQGIALFTGNGEHNAVDSMGSPALPDDRGQEPQVRAEQDRSLGETCEEAGWPYTPRAGGQIAVPLDVDGLFCQALIGPADEGHRRVWVELEAAQSRSAASEQAVNVLLLSASRVVRMARAAAIPGGERTMYRWEVILRGVPSASELGHALSALSVACRITAREVQALGDEPTAQRYLAVRGWGSLLSSQCP